MASRSLGQLTIDLVAKIGGFTAPLDQAEREADKRLKKIKANADSTALSMSKLAGGITGVFAGVSIGAFIDESIRGFIAQEKALAQIDARLKSTGGSAGKTTEEIARLAGELQRVSTYGDDAILQMQSVLLTFTGIRGDNFDKATKAVLDLSVAMGQDLQSSAVQVGKALNNPTEGLAALSRIGVKFTDQQKEQIKVMEEAGDVAGAQAIILQELSVEFGGAAEAARNTLGGALESLQTRLGDVGEALVGLAGGDSAGGAVNKATDALIGLQFVIEDLDSLLSRISPNVDGFSGKLLSLVPGLGPVLDMARALEAYGQFRSGQEAALPPELTGSQLLPAGMLEDIMRDDARFVHKTGKAKKEKKGGKSEEEKRADSIQKIIDGLRKEAETLGMTTEATRIYELQQLKASESEIALAQSLTDKITAYEKEQELLKSITEGTLEFADTTDELRSGALAAYQEAVNSLLTTEEQRLKTLRETQAIIAAGPASEEKDKALATVSAEIVGVEDERIAKEAEAQKKIAEIENAAYMARLAAGEQFFATLSSIAATYAGKQSGVYKALFAVEKAFALASALLNAQKAISNAYASGTYPYNLANVAAAAAAVGQVVSTIASIAAPSMKGMAHDGIDSVPQSGTWLLEKGERVTTAETSAKLDATLDDVKSGGSQPPIVNLYEDKSKAGRVESSKQDGKWVIDLFVSDLMADGKTKGALSNKFGLQGVGS